MNRISVLISHDSPLIRAGLAATLREHSDLDVCVEYPSRPGAPAQLALCDVLVADYATCIRALGASAPADARHKVPKVLIIAAQAGEWDIRFAMRQGVQGYLLLGCAADKLVHAVRSLARGGRCLDDAVSERIAESLVHEPLTNREQDVLYLIAEGAGNKHIANALDIQLGTVKAHVKAILAKLHVRTRTQALIVAEQRGLLSARARVESSRDRVIPSSSRPTMSVEAW